jgi:hypothetical protein
MGLVQESVGASAVPLIPSSGEPDTSPPDGSAQLSEASNIDRSEGKKNNAIIIVPIVVSIVVLLGVVGVLAWRYMAVKRRKEREKISEQYDQYNGEADGKWVRSFPSSLLTLSS